MNNTRNRKELFLEQAVQHAEVREPTSENRPFRHFHPEPGQTPRTTRNLFRKVFRDDDHYWPWHVLFIRWIKHERVYGTNVFTDQSWLPREIPYFPTERHPYELNDKCSNRTILDIFRGLLEPQLPGADPLREYRAFEQRIFSAHEDLACYLLKSRDAFILTMILNWAWDKRHVAERISMKGQDNDPAATVYQKRRVENNGDLVINPFTVSFEDWVFWAKSRLIFDFVRGVEMQVLRMVNRTEHLHRWVSCTWRPAAMQQLSEEILREALDRTLALGTLRALKLLKKTELPGRFAVELPVRFELLYQTINRFTPLDIKSPFTKVFYPLISVFLGPGVLLGELNILDYFGVRWKCPCFWTGTSLFRVDRTVLW